MEFECVCKQYGLGEFLQATPMKPGTASQVWRLETSMGAVVLRSLADREQGEREWRVYTHLSDCGFSEMPSILPSATGTPCVVADGVWYQVQEFVEGAMPDPASPGMAAALAILARKLSNALADCPSGPMIHGDLGPWNILCGPDGRLDVIDFGSVRKGDSYYDYASLFGGIINHTPEKLRRTVCGEFVRELNCDRERLMYWLERWAEQGMDAWAGRSEQMAARFRNARSWAEEYLYEL